MRADKFCPVTIASGQSNIRKIGPFKAGIDQMGPCQILFLEVAAIKIAALPIDPGSRGLSAVRCQRGQAAQQADKNRCEEEQSWKHPLDLTWISSAVTKATESDHQFTWAAHRPTL